MGQFSPGAVFRAGSRRRQRWQIPATAFRNLRKCTHGLSSDSAPMRPVPASGVSKHLQDRFNGHRGICLNGGGVPHSFRALGRTAIRHFNPDRSVQVGHASLFATARPVQRSYRWSHGSQRCGRRESGGNLAAARTTLPAPLLQCSR